MAAPNLAGINLSLLLVFEALIDEQSVSRAARKVGLTQPAVSNALSRLRLLVHDDLFVRTPKGMRPTPRALELVEPIRDALAQIRTALEQPERFDPATTERQFAIGASDNLDFSLAMCVPAILEAAPRAGLSWVDAVGPEVVLRLLDAGSIDIAVGRFDVLPKRLVSVPLYTERYACVARRGHPDLTDGVTLDQLVALPHLLVTRDTTQIIDAALAERGLARRSTVRVPYFALVPHALRNTSLLAVVGERIARACAEDGTLEYHDLPIDLPPWEISAVWRRQVNRDEGVLWLAGVLKQAASKLSG